MKKNTEILFLFDVDGTLSPSRDKAPPKIIHMLKELKKRVSTAFVGGSDIEKQREQIGNELLEIFDYGFPENGVQFYRNGKIESSSSILEYLGEKNYKALVNRILLILSQTDCPIKRGTFIELRTSMLNVSPIGRSCSRTESKEFFEFDKIHKVRETVCKRILADFDSYVNDEAGASDAKPKIRCAIGGEISIDIFPDGWDKTYCLNHVKEKKVYFFGDMTAQGGNDYEICNHERVHGKTVTGPEDTFNKVNEALKSLGIEEIE